MGQALNKKRGFGASDPVRGTGLGTLNVTGQSVRRQRGRWFVRIRRLEPKPIESNIDDIASPTSARDDVCPIA